MRQRIELTVHPQRSAAESTGEGVDAIRVPADVCRDHARSSRLEWLETNGTGGFAMGTVAGTNTRRYHGLLVVPLRPPGERHVLLARLEETVVA
ncbi:MAG: glycogen debranching enzyme N-terminal domain-containing protein, partial [Anaeromyxobacteraceae bacterium]